MGWLRNLWRRLLNKTTIDEKIVETYNEIKEDVEEVVEEVRDVLDVVKGKVTKAKLRALTKSQLQKQAQSNFGVELPSSMNKSTMVNKVYELYHSK